SPAHLCDTAWKNRGEGKEKHPELRSLAFGQQSDRSQNEGQVPPPYTRKSPTMCFKAKCLNCGKWTWKGCGKHIDSVMTQIPAAEQCHCSPEARKPE
ncbi:uncharacterized protein ACA1_071590, partial [Acanthamoeba castellanii str. Neff]